MRPTRVQIDLEALRNNIELLRQWNGDEVFFCPMVKANAYGHGDILIARAIEKMSVSAVGVALVEEGIRLREAGIQMPILVFAPLNALAARQVVDSRLTPVVGRFEDLAHLQALPSRQGIDIHLKFNTGLQRLGFDASEIDELARNLRQASPQLCVKGLCTHLTHGADAHRPESVTAVQLRRFAHMTRDFPGQRHVHKSASLVALHENGVKKNDLHGARPGISLYGLPHEGAQVGRGLKPVLRWTSTVVRVHDVAEGEGVSYGGAWKAPRRSRIGVVPAGYGDGYMRILSNRGEMLFRQRRVPVVGCVSMDYTLVDLSECSGGGPVQTGEEIVLLGTQGSQEVSAAQLAEKAGTIAYEIVTNIGSRVPREAR